MSLGWMRRALTPKNWVQPKLRPYVTPAEARAMCVWPVLGTAALGVVEGEVLDWPSWAVALSALVVFAGWTEVVTVAVCQRALKRLNHEHLKP